MTKTIEKIAEIADVSIRPTCDSADDNDDEAKNSDNDSNASDGDDTADWMDDAEKKQNVDLPDPSKLTSCSREDITAFVTKLYKTDFTH